MYRHFVVLGMVIALFGCQSEAPKPLDHVSEQKMTAAGVPVKTRQAFERDHPNVRIEETRKLIKKNGDVHYEFKFDERDGRKGEAEYDAQGFKALP